MTDSSTVTVTGSSRIGGNTANTVSSPASRSPLSSWLIRQGATDTRSLKKRDFTRCSSSEETLPSPACPLAERRRCLYDGFFHGDGDGRLEHRR